MKHRSTPPILALAALAACSHKTPPPRPAAPTPALAATRRVPASPAVETTPPARTYRRPDCLTDEHGLPLMVQITQPGVRVGGVELPMFAPFYYVLGRNPEQGPIAEYLIGRTRFRSSALGRCKVSATAVWSSTVGAFPLGRVNVYATATELEQLLRTGRTGPPLAISAQGAQRRPFLWPIVETRTIEVGGKPHELWRIHFLGRQAGAKRKAPTGAATPRPQPRYTAAEQQSFAQQLRQLDVVWVIDATGSMKSFWNAAQQLVRGITARLGAGGRRRQATLRLGLVAFRDHDPRSGFATRTYPFGSEQQFRNSLRSVQVDAGGDIPEAGLDALHAALGYPWGTGGLASRIVVMVSDASFHEGIGPQNPRRHSRLSIAVRAKQLGVHVFGLAVGQQQSTPDRLRQRAQYQDLARSTGGACLAIEQVDQAVRHIEAILDRAAQGIDQRVRVFDALRQGASSVAEVTAKTSLPAQQVTECLEFLAGKIELGRLGAGGTAFASGWVLPSYKGVPQLERRTLMSRADSELLRDACRKLIADLGGDARESKKGLERIAIGGRTALSALVPDHQAEVGSYLAARYKIPCHQNSVLRLTQVELRMMSDQERLRRLDDVAVALKRLIAFERDDRNWFRIHGEEYCFAPEEVLP